MTIIYCNIKIMKLDNQISIPRSRWFIIGGKCSCSVRHRNLPSYYQQSIYNTNLYSTAESCRLYLQDFSPYLISLKEFYYCSNTGRRLLQHYVREKEEWTSEGSGVNEDLISLFPTTDRTLPLASHSNILINKRYQRYK